MATNKKGYLKMYYQNGRNEVLTALGGVCNECGSKNDLQIHHINPLNGNRPNGQLARLTEWRRNIDNLELLCERCHRAVHKMEEAHPLNVHKTA